jgi:hypothetical protein
VPPQKNAKITSKLLISLKATFRKWRELSNSGGQHRQRVAQIDHLVQAVAEKIVGHGAAFKNSQKTASIEYLFESFGHRDSPQITSIHPGSKGFAGATT